MSLIRRLILDRRFCTAVARRAEDIMSNPDCRPTDLCFRVSYLINSIGDLDTAAKYARLAVFTRIESEYTAITCQHIIGGMFLDKRHKDTYDLYDFFFNQHKLRPNSGCCNYIIESRFQQGLVDEALDFHRSIKSNIVRDYPSDGTFRVLTKGLVHSGRLDQAEALLKARTVKGAFIYPDHVAYNNLIRGYLDLGNLDKANLVLDEFKGLLSSAIALSKSTCDFFHSEFHPGYEDRVAFLMATFMEYWFKQGKEVEAMECYHQSVLANKLPVCPETGNALLKVLLKYGQRNHAWALYHEILDQSGTGLDSDTVKIMVKECFDMGRCSEAIDTYSKAKARAKTKFLSEEYILTRCCENGMLSEAESLFADSLADGFDVTTFKTIIDAYVKAGRIDDAMKTSNKMIDATLKELSHLF